MEGLSQSEPSCVPVVRVHMRAFAVRLHQYLHLNLVPCAYLVTVSPLVLEGNDVYNCNWRRSASR